MKKIQPKSGIHEPTGSVHGEQTLLVRSVRFSAIQVDANHTKIVV